jgi:methionine-rich copper-binding protein CopC
MRAIWIVVCLALALVAPCASAFGSRQDPAPVDPKAVEKAVAALEAAFKEGKSPDRIAAIEGAATLADPAVISRIARGLEDRDAAVQASAIEALRFLKHPDALAALHERLQRDKKLAKDPERHAKLLKAIGQHGSPSSIALLADGGVVPDALVMRARVLALANVRTRAALEQVFALMRTGGREQIDLHMGAFRLALVRLTGTDLRDSQDDWNAWWNDHKKDFVVAEKPPLLPKEMQIRWDEFWGTYTDRGRGTERGERGK